MWTCSGLSGRSASSEAGSGPPILPALDPPATRTGRRQSGSAVGARHAPPPQSSMALPQPCCLGQECPCLGHGQCGCGPSSCRVRSTGNGACPPLGVSAVALAGKGLFYVKVARMPLPLVSTSVSERLRNSVIGVSCRRNESWYWPRSSTVALSWSWHHRIETRASVPRNASLV